MSLSGSSWQSDFSDKGCHHPARVSKAALSKTADRVLGVHGFVIGVSVCVIIIVR
jgi:hypothetical protein